MTTLRVCALYPEMMNVYADRGNLLILQRRCEWRDIRFELRSASVGAELDPASHDLYYLGGGQDADQRRCAADLVATKRDALLTAAGSGAVLIGICGGYQLFGVSYQLGDETLPGIGLLDVQTTRDDNHRLVGPISIEVELDGEPRTIAGFENHAGRTFLASGTHPLGRVRSGHGNNGLDGTEGARAANVIGTYLHGPLLAKNTWLADWIIARAVKAARLPPLADDLETSVHQMALHVAEHSA